MWHVARFPLQDLDCMLRVVGCTAYVVRCMVSCVAASLRRSCARRRNGSCRCSCCSSRSPSRCQRRICQFCASASFHPPALLWPQSHRPLPRDPIRSAPLRGAAARACDVQRAEWNGMGWDWTAGRGDGRCATKEVRKRLPCLSRSARSVRAVAPIERKGILQSDADSDASVWRDGGLCGTARLPDDEHVGCRMLQLGGAEGGDE